MTIPDILNAAWPQAAARLPKILLVDALTSRSRELYCRRNGHMWSLESERCLWCGSPTA
ncbi:hypothetical protein [Jatrophihabitans sp.]|uniref:hypothetical protein n=1 Tax=Jatrophihabitans sp. TaxID=1932789 RepID=UPI0030C6FC8E|nr:hypothetical protein [Jatrophihabitans sp.]